MDKKGILNLCFGGLGFVGVLGFVITLDAKTIENFKNLKSAVLD